MSTTIDKTPPAEGGALPAETAAAADDLRGRARPAKQRLSVPLLATLAVAPAGAWIAAGTAAAASVAEGELLSWLNVWVLRRVVVGLSRPDAGGGLFALVLPFKFLGVVAGAYALVHLGLAEPLWLAVGFASLPLALSLSSSLRRLPALLSPSTE